MPTIDLAAWDAAGVAVLLLVVPFYARRTFRTMCRRLTTGDATARLRAYRSALVEQWLFAAVVTTFWLSAARSLAALGVQVQPTRGFGIASALVALAVAFLVFQTRLVLHNEAARQQVREQLGSVAALLPTTRRELRRFMALAMTAGICEELVYRGYLMAVMAAAGGPVLAVAGSTVAFAVGHLYQPANLVRVAAVGLVTALLYLLAGSLLPVMVLHVAIDAAGGVAAFVARRGDADGSVDEAASSAAATS